MSVALIHYQIEKCTVDGIEIAKDLRREKAADFFPDFVWNIEHVEQDERCEIVSLGESETVSHKQGRVSTSPSAR